MWYYSWDQATEHTIFQYSILESDGFLTCEASKLEPSTLSSYGAPYTSSGWASGFEGPKLIVVVLGQAFLISYAFRSPSALLF